MRHSRVPVARVVAATLVTVTTILLVSVGAIRTHSDREQAYARLHSDLAIDANQIAAGLALPVWNIDRAQIGKIIEGLAPTQAIFAVEVDAAAGRQALMRDAAWRLAAATGQIPTDGLLVEHRPIFLGNERIGSVRLVATPRFIEEGLRERLMANVITVIATDLLLILGVYLVLWRSVLGPLVRIEKYAVAVSAGERAAPQMLVDAASPNELESLGASLRTMVELLDRRYAEVQESEARFRTIFDSVNDAILIHDSDSGAILDVNARMCEIFGYTPAEARQMTMPELGAAPYVELDPAAHDAGAKEERQPLFEWRARHKDGRFFWTEVNTRTAIIGGARRVLVVVREITERKEIEQALEAEKEFTETAINAMTGIFFVQDRAGRYIRWNHALEAVLGVPLIRDANVTVHMPFVHPDDRMMIAAKREEVFERGYSSSEMRVVVPGTGETRHYLMNGRRMDVAGQPFLVGTGIDITDRRRAEAERERLAAEWRETFDSVTTPIVITDANGFVRRMNESAAKLAGTADAGSHVGELGVEPWHTAAELIVAFDASAEHSAAETRDDAGRTWELQINRLLTERGDGSLIVVFWEITGFVELQESLRRSETMSAMGKLVAGVAHEVRNPLFGISATLDAYASELNTPDLADLSNALREQVTRLTQLMRELLEFGKPVAVVKTPGALHELVDNVLAARARAATEARITLRSNVPAALPPVPMDRDRLRQVFENLVDNALQHSSAGRSVMVYADALVHGGRHWIECRIEDEGPGFRPEDFVRVFEPFFTRRERGTGLGLSVVQRIVEEHAGKVVAGNRGEGGGVVTMLLPLSSS